MITLCEGANLVLPHRALSGSWSIDRGDIAALGPASGQIRARQAGEATLSYRDIHGAKKSLHLKVIEKPLTPVRTLSLRDQRLMPGGEIQIPLAQNPAKSDDVITWVAQDVSVATVDDTGLVRAVGAGETAVTAFSSGGVMASAKIRVYAPVKTLTITRFSTQMKVGEQALFTYAMTGGHTSFLRWESSDTAVLTVDKNGLVTAKGTGRAQISCTAGDKTASVSVRVSIFDMQISLSPSAIVLNKGDTKALDVLVVPLSYRKHLVYESSDSAVATVSSGGLITARGPGSARISVRSQSGETERVCQVTVVDAQIKNAIYTWWTSPVAVTDGTKLFAGFTDNKGKLGVALWNGSRSVNDKTLYKQSVVDDHNNVSITMRKDGKLLAVYFTHYGRELRYKISTKPGSISAWGAEKKLPCYIVDKKGRKVSSKISYAQVVRVNNSLWLFSRAGRDYWSVRVSNNEGKTWSDQKVFLGLGVTTYAKITLSADGSQIHIVAYPNPHTSTERALYYTRIDTKTGVFYDLYDHKIGEMSAFSSRSAKALKRSDLTKLYSAPRGSYMRLYDVAETNGRLYISYGEWKASQLGKQSGYAVLQVGPDGEMRTDDVVQSGKPLGGSSSIYYGGTAFMPGDGTTQIVARESDGIWQVERWKFDGDRWINEETLIMSENKLFRPTITSGPNPALLVIEGTYRRYKSYSTHINVLRLK